MIQKYKKFNGVLIEEICLRCDDLVEVLTFSKITWKDGDVSYDFSIEDAYSRPELCGILGRCRRAWKAFWAKPMYSSGIAINDISEVKKFLEDSMSLISTDTRVCNNCMHYNHKTNDCHNGNTYNPVTGNDSCSSFTSFKEYMEGLDFDRRSL